MLKKFVKTASMLLISGVFLSGCAQSTENPTNTSSPIEQTQSPSETPTIDEEAEMRAELTETACQSFFGDESNYQYSLSSDVLANAGSAKYNNIQDAYLYEITSESIDELFQNTNASEKSDALVEWLNDEAVKGKEADLEAFEKVYINLANSCSEYSAAADWVDFDENNEKGTKPSALVCSQVFNTPMTLDVYYNQNVLTSNMFKDAGLYPRDMSSVDKDQLERTRQHLTKQAELVDSDAVRDALLKIRKPYEDALDNGDYWSDGLEEPLDSLEDACIAEGFEVVK